MISTLFVASFKFVKKKIAILNKRKANSNKSKNVIRRELC